MIRRPVPDSRSSGERVAGEALEEAQQDQDDTDDPVGLTRLAERAGEEHPEHVDDHRGHEQQGCPVVDLADEQPAAHVHRDATELSNAFDMWTPRRLSNDPL